MNKVCLIGRLTADVETRANNNNISIARFSLAVNRPFNNEKGERGVDFINCVAWNKTAELINKYFKKGSQIGIEGRIQTGSYTKKDGSKAYTTDVIVESITFIGNKENKNNYAPEGQPTQPTSDPFADFGQEVVITDDMLPFN